MARKTMTYTLNRNTATAALTRAINKAVAEGAPVYVNQPADLPPMKLYGQHPDEVDDTEILVAHVEGRN
jgi:TPP-dependent 2-oxoacid decarboxylase